MHKAYAVELSLIDWIVKEMKHKWWFSIKDCVKSTVNYKVMKMYYANENSYQNW